MRECRTYGSVRGLCPAMGVPTAIRLFSRQAGLTRPDELVQLLPWHWHSEQLVAAVPQKVHLTLENGRGIGEMSMGRLASTCSAHER